MVEWEYYSWGQCGQTKISNCRKLGEGWENGGLYKEIKGNKEYVPIPAELVRGSIHCAVPT